jgi:hypothetical protein
MYLEKDKTKNEAKNIQKINVFQEIDFKNNCNDPL